MSLTKSTGTFINPLSPVYDLPYDPKGGSGILKAIIWEKVKMFIPSTQSFEYFDISNEHLLAYSWLETAPNGLVIEIEKPVISDATAIEEDINLALSEEFKGKSYTINFISK